MSQDAHTSGTIGERLRAHWLAGGMIVRPGVREPRLAEFEARHRVRLPSDLRAYFAVVDGMDPEQFDDDFFRFWPIAEIEPATVAYPFAHRNADPFGDLGSYFPFADHSICLPTFAIRLTHAANAKNVVIAAYTDGGQCECTVVAASFTDFAERYLAGVGPRNDLLSGDPIDPKAKFWAAPPADPGHPLWDRDVDG